MARPSLSPLSSLGFPFSNIFPGFLKTWNYVPRTQWFTHFITINNNDRDAPVEQHVLEEVGSYGLQLGRILDALDVLIAHVDQSDLTMAEITKLGTLTELHGKVSKAIEQYRANPAVSPAGVL